MQNKLSKAELIFAIVVGCLTGMLVVLGYFIAISEPKNSQSQSPLIPQAYAAEHISPSTTPSAYVAETPKPQHIYTGYVSYYSHAGCLGCGEKQIMGNGQPFDENAMTLAVPCELIRSKKLKYNLTVRVTNVKTGSSITALLTDCGGFGKYPAKGEFRRVADLSKGLFDALEARTDNTIITLEVL